MQARIYIAYIADSNKIALSRFERFVISGLDVAELPRSTSRILARSDDSSQPIIIRLWATTAGSASQRYFENAAPGDKMFFVVGKYVRAVGTIGSKLASRALAQRLWNVDKYSNFYKFSAVQLVDIKRSELLSALGYRPDLKLRGLRIVSTEAAARIRERLG